MPATPPKPLSKLEQQVLDAVLVKLKPALEAAAERAKLALREDIGEKGVTFLGKLGADIDNVLLHGLPPISVKTSKLLAGATGALVVLGLYQRAKS